MASSRRNWVEKRRRLKCILNLILQKAWIGFMLIEEEPLNNRNLEAYLNEVNGTHLLIKQTLGDGSSSYQKVWMAQSQL
jgi:hypothetical protein